MQSHPVANIFPPMSDSEFTALKADISKHGVRERIWTWRGMLIDGRHRERACTELAIPCPAREWEGDESGLVPFVVSLNLNRRHLSESQRAMVANEIAKLPAHRPSGSAQGCAVTQSDAGTLLNVSRRLIQDARAIETASPELAREVKAGAKTVTQAKREIKHRQSRAALEKIQPVSVEGFHIGDFRKLSASIPDGSVDLVFTDPPYDRDSIPLIEAAAEIAARILKPGGSFLAYIGHIQLPDALAALKNHLRFWWVNACVHSDGRLSRMTEYGIVVGWKPIVWFVKGTRADKQTMVRDAVSGGREKGAHEWQQAQAEAEYYIENLTAENGLVVDFFAGGGTTCVAAKALGRRWIAYEIDNAAAASAGQRILRAA